jgi:UDP-N-acetylmuramoyl-L-alanyl-D-glutamate--2,6-diaminopimelate ligase
MSALLGDFEVVEVRGDPAATDVRSIEFDSRQVTAGSLFCCVPGAHTDGHRFAAEAVGRGATALLCERTLDLDVTQARVPDGGLRAAMASVASSFYDHPSRAMRMVGVTGTNGKTTVTQLIRAVLDHAAVPAGVIGTLVGARTTPEAPDLQRLLAEFRDRGDRAVAMEVSSHALTQHRVDSIVFDVAAFTNLSRDHLDHHGSMEEYFGAKARLFESTRARSSVIFVDDPWGRRLASELGGRSVVEVRRSEATEVVTEVGRSSFRWRGRAVELPLTGAFNIDNFLVAAAVAGELGLDERSVVEGVSGTVPVPGRMEVVTSGEPVSVIVDYAHTPAALDRALAAARDLAGPGRVICLFGCGGDRDQGKRSEMGAVATHHADVIVLTSDNPRSEDPGAIIEDIRGGTAGFTPVVVEPDRARAIGWSIGAADKGHETTQTAQGRSWPFDDRVEARRALADRFGAGSA